MQVQTYGRWIAGVLILTATTPVFAQPRGGPGRSPSAQVNERFQSAPEIGKPLPDVTLYDADGNELRLRDLKGNYSVLVFGCLT